MTQHQLQDWSKQFEAFHARFAHVFSRSEPRQQAITYVRGLLAPVQRKNSWQLAEAVGQRQPDSMQRLLYQSVWDADAARDVLQQFIRDEFGDEDGIGVVDETGFVKKGRHSVGVQRQYCGTVGKVENCQVGTFLSYATGRGHVLLDRRLYLPEAWCEDAQRRAAARVPQHIGFATKPQQALEMLQQAWERGIPMRWVTGDEVYGDAAFFRAAVESGKRWYVLAVSASAPVWVQRPQVQQPAGGTRGRPRTKARLAPGAPRCGTAAQVVAGWSAQRWKRFSVGPGEKGPRVYDWAAMRVVESREGLPGSDVWLLARRSVTEPADVAYYLSNAPKGIGLRKLAAVASTRYSIERCFQEAKGETGLDEYEVRYWHSWHRHITLSMMAHAWLSWIRAKARATPQTGAKKGTARRSSRS